MKKTILILMFVSITSITFAQVKWDVRFGGNLSGMSDGDMTMKFGVKTGLALEYAFSELFAIRPSIYYSMKGASDAKTPFDFSPKNTLKLNYLEIPVLASFRFKLAEKFVISLNAGPSLGYCVSKKPSTLEEMNRFDAGVNMGIDFVFNQRFVIGVESQYCFSKLVNDNTNLKNITYSLMFGYRF
jgi:hypothetical protein